MKLPGDFYATYWQQAPLFQPSAVDLTALTPSVEQLWEWARDSHAARLVQPNRGFEVTLDPIQAPSDTHTLLVGQIEQQDPAWDAWTRSLPTIGRWSFADLMISHATTGASVGAHRDRYDVFLIQLAGHRRWQIGTVADRDLPEENHGGSHLLPGFVADQTVEAGPGDLLYVPPGCGHHGEALDDECMTLSVGFRQPTMAQLLERLAELADDTLVPDLRTNAPALAIRDVDSLRASLHDWLDQAPAHWLAGAWGLACTQLSDGFNEADSSVVRFPSWVRAASISDTQCAVMGELFDLSSNTLSKLVDSQVDIDQLNDDEIETLELFRDAGWLEDH